MEEGKTRGVKAFSELARPLTSACVYLSGHRVRPLNCRFQHATSTIWKRPSSVDFLAAIVGGVPEYRWPGGGAVELD